ncbi:MAG: M23 family metallopeptidase [Microcystaceae cyanobacterium]
MAIRPLFPSFKVPEHQLRSPNYPSFNSSVLGKMIFTGGFMEPHGHAWKSPTKAVMSDGKLHALPASDRNLGIDYVYPPNDKAIRCWYPGKVIKVGWEGGYGNRCRMAYDIKFKLNGKEYPVLGAYAHAKSFHVKIGQRVNQGDKIGIEGGTGGRYPSHVDYRQWIVVNGQVIDLSPNILEAQLNHQAVEDDGRIRVLDNRPQYDLNAPVTLQGEASAGIYGVRIHSPLAGQDYELAKTLVKNGRWQFSYQFNTAGERTLIIDGIDAADKVISSTSIQFTLSPNWNNEVGRVKILHPTQGQKVDLELAIDFQGEVTDNRINTVKLLSPFADKRYVLGSAAKALPLTNGRWQHLYKFNTGGERTIVAEGLDAQGRVIDRTAIKIMIQSGQTTESHLKPVMGIENTTAAFQRKVLQIASELDVDPSYLMAVMSFETGGTFSPSIRDTARNGAIGLIQFLPATARKLGTSTQVLGRMSAMQQLDYVKKYLWSYRGRLNTLEAVYMSILYPAAIGKRKNDVLFRQGSLTYHQHRWLDWSGKGYITVEDATKVIYNRFKA